ncbi:DUF4202 domain-containing protein [Catalinimonas niigatensis]|uniref:DUF4202 domain-containing protein n=1 Tax=Catalinimonas niigatensis TaxID=1397264 RepID=UPI002666603E|nr:DUF4202 domain-containing protein [Catalinimonas niigatensis]WPP49006.1 DUF4202 domain-containing protein [Catalinimonas niigatensis]
MNISDKDRFARTLAAFDAANTEDPHQEEVEGKMMPKELVYGQRMSEMLAGFAPEASETLQLSARCQHIQRWTLPRSNYPMDRKGYLKWRTQLKLFHGKKAAEIMETEGYDAEMIERVKFLLNKQKLKSDPETQTLEDVICLVFLKYYFSDFTKQHSEEKLIDIVAKTWGKMSEKGHEAAMQLSFSPEEQHIIQKALA